MADIHLTNAECREAGGDKKAAASELAIARRSITDLTHELSSDPAVAELTRRADALLKTLGN